MTELTFPGLYHEADSASNRQQKMFLWVIRAEFAALFAASILTINIVPEAWYIIVYGLVMVLAAGLLIFRSTTKPEQSWYQARALAESIKTTTWKYAMQSKPFDHHDNDALDRAFFRNFLKDLLRTNQQVGAQFDGSSATMDQVTDEMAAIRALDTTDRLALYMDQRVENQRRWYAVKAGNNRTWAKMSVFALVALYTLAFIALLVRVAKPEWAYSHPEPLILLATALIGWMQIKKFNELATSYNLTALEIGILKSRAPEIESDEALSDFIDDAEEAFSREHTQWLARRSHN